MRKLILLVAVLACLLASASSALASHGSPYHWPDGNHNNGRYLIHVDRTNNATKGGASITSSMLTTGGRWNSKATMLIFAYQEQDGQPCAEGWDQPATTRINDRIVICAGNYGAIGWLGLTFTFIYTATPFYSDGQIRYNTYNLNNYATPINQITCHEQGHGAGIGHNEEAGSCMHAVASLNGIPQYPSNHDGDAIRVKQTHSAGDPQFPDVMRPPFRKLKPKFSLRARMTLRSERRIKGNCPYVAQRQTLLAPRAFNAVDAIRPLRERSRFIYYCFS